MRTTITSITLLHGALHAGSLQLDAKILHKDFAQALQLDGATGAFFGAALRSAPALGARLCAGARRLRGLVVAHGLVDRLQEVVDAGASVIAAGAL